AGAGRTRRLAGGGAHGAVRGSRRPGADARALHHREVSMKEGGMKPGRAAASFDSATGMLRALARHLAGREVPMLGQLPPSLERPVSVLLGGANKLPRRPAEALYTASGVGEAVPRGSTGEVDSDLLARWVVEHYPKQRYDVVFAGSA